MKKCFGFGKILLPKNLNTHEWSVVACDQYTSDPEYWHNLESTLREPSTLGLIFPECFLGENDEERITAIAARQREYLENGIFREIDGAVALRRKMQSGKVRQGLMCLVDLDAYSVNEGEKSLIRATEGLVEERIPPRVAIRSRCPLELPHILLLIDDSKRTVIEPLFEGNTEIIYDGDLNSGGGSITGYAVHDTEKITYALSLLEKECERQYGEPLLFLVGDGNHSLATAKACVDENEPLSRYALVEVVNIYDEGLEFFPIHRAVFDVDNDDFIEKFSKFISSQSGNTAVYNGSAVSEIPFPLDPIEGIKLTQQFIDEYIASHGGRVDYIHGDSDLQRICAARKAVGIKLLPLKKSEFFGYVVKNGTLPRKTFSLGEASEKRYYMEARLIKSNIGE